MIHHTVLALVMALVVCGCSPNPQVAAQLSEEDKIREAVFWYQFEFNVSGLGKTANAYFLSVEGGSDPSPQLLKQFDGHRPLVKPVSASMLEAGTAQVLDRESELPGLVFRIMEIRWLSDEEVEVEGGYEEASESGAGNMYRLEREGGHWEVVESQMLWVK
jgi:hypothetical protein